MRIISQSGLLDVAYETLTVIVSDGSIYARTDISTRGCLMAEYSSQEIALRAMAKMHHAYESTLFAVFRFPSEEEMQEPQNRMEWKDFDLARQVIEGDDGE